MSAQTNKCTTTTTMTRHNKVYTEENDHRKGEDREGGDTASEYHKDIVSDLCLDHPKCCYSKFLFRVLCFILGEG